MRERDDLDRLLDSALKSYSESEASPSLEQRILARIAAEPSVAAGPRWMPWAVVLPLAAALLLFVFLAAPNIKNRPARHAQNTPEAKHDFRKPVGNQPSLAFRAAQNPRPRVPHAVALASVHAAQTARVPKRDVFPTPQPLTSEEQALVVFVADAPENERKAVADAQQRMDAPISVAAIHIPPLESPHQGQP